MANSTTSAKIINKNPKLLVFMRPMIISLVFLLVVTPVLVPFSQAKAQEVPVLPEQSIVNRPDTAVNPPTADVPETTPAPEFKVPEVNPETPENQASIPEIGENNKNDQAGKPLENPQDGSDPEEAEKTATESLATASSTIADAGSVQFEIPTQTKASVDQSTGALTYSYPIEMPEGRAGMTPKLELSYNSRNASRPDNLAGLGWDISIPYIVREPVKGTQNLYSKAYFSSSLSGNLIATTDTSSSQYATYRPETDGGEYLKYTFNSDNSWSMIGKDGVTYVFGAAVTSRQNNPSDAAKIYKWMVTSITDAHGNSIQYTYIKDSGQIYPSQITYTNHASAPATHTVAFTYTTPASYGSTVYNSGFAVTTFKLLSTITVTTTVSPSTEVHTYTFAHINAQFLKQKLLASITHTYSLSSTGYNQSFNDVTSYTYSTKTPGWQEGTFSLENILPIADEVMAGVTIADFDLNGYQDILIAERWNSGGSTHSAVGFALNNGITFVDSSTAWSLPSELLDDPKTVVDLNGDRLPDLDPRTLHDSNIYLNTGSGFVLDPSGTWNIGNYITNGSVCAPNVGTTGTYENNIFLHDMNGDGKSDIVYFGGTSNFQVWLNNGNGWTQSNAYTFTPAPGVSFTVPNDCGDSNMNNSVNYQTLIDVNGDGLKDYFNEVYGMYLNTGSGFAYNSAYDFDTDEVGKSGWADINGDGLLDYIAFKRYNGTNHCSLTYLNNGNGFTMASPLAFPPCTASTNYNPYDLLYANGEAWERGILLDVTADNYPDIVGSTSSSGSPGRVRSINDGQKTWVNNPTSGDVWDDLRTPKLSVLLDVNNDEAVDYISSKAYVYTPKQVMMGQPNVPNRLTQITTPLRAQTVVEYGAALTSSDDSAPSPMGVVKKITVQNLGLNQPSMVTQYGYSNGFYVVDSVTGQKRFAGFHKVTSTESGVDLNAVRVTDTYFHQANGSDSATNEPADTSFSLIGKSYYSVTKNPANTLKKETWNKYGQFTLVTEPVIGRTSKFVYPTETVSKSTEPGATTGTADVYTFDTALGEQTELRNLGFVTVGSDGSYSDISGDTRYQFIEYVSNAAGTIVKPKRVDIRTTSNSSDTVSRTEYFYDAQAYGVMGTKGDRTKQTQWVSGNGSVTADTSYTFDVYGNVLTVANPRNALTTYVYDTSKSQVVTETNHLNHVTTYEYQAGKLKKVTDPNGRTATYVYSNKGWLYSTTTMNTGGSHVVSQTLGQTNGVWTVETQTTLVSSGRDTTVRAFDNLGRMVRRMRELKNYTTNVDTYKYLKEAKNYDVMGREVTTSAPYGTPAASAYDTLLTVVVPSNLVTTTSYDVFDRPISVVNSIGTTSYDYAGPQTTTTDANGKLKKTKTDAYGNIVEVKEHNGNEVYTTTYSYDIRNLLTNITDAVGNIRNFTYNNAGWVTVSEDLHAASDVTFGQSSYTYDLNGNKLVEVQPNDVTVTRVYDMLDRPTSLDGSSTAGTDYTYTYDSCTNGKGRICTVNGSLPNSTTLTKTFVYGISGVPTSASIATLGTTYTTSYLYNRSDEISQITYPNGTVVRYAFGDWAKPGTVYTKLPGGVETTYATISYHHTEQPQTIVVTSGPTTTHTYDAAKLYRKTNSVTTMGGNTLQSYVYTYDNLNNITQVVEPNLTKQYTYDDLSRLTLAQHTPSGGSATSYTYAYDALGNIISANGQNYSYSGVNKTNPHAVTAISGPTTSTELLSGNWNLAGNNGSDEEYQTVPADILNGKDSITVTYNLHGLCALGGDASAIIFDQNGWKYVSLSNYGQNCLDGVQTVTIPLSDFAGLNTAANLTGSLHSRFWFGSAFNVDISSIKINATAGGSSAFTYDDNGNMVTAPNQALTFNWQNQATRITVGGTTNIDSYYDESGERFIYKTPTTTEVQVDDSYIVRGGVPEISIKAGGVNVGSVVNGALYAAINDHLGTPVKQINTAGVTAESVSYGPFGTILSQTGTINTKHGYTGHEEDLSTGLNYAEARYFNPTIGKFISEDPAFWDFSRLKVQIGDPQSWNSYSYARNNPIKYNDPDGEFWDTIIDVGFTAWDGSKFIQHSGQWIGDQATIGLGKFLGNSRLESVGRKNSIQSGANLKGSATNLSIDLGATIVPGLPAFVGRVDDAAKLVNKLSDADKYIDNVDDIIPAAKQNHILQGDETGGGHMYGANKGKSEFPSNWTPKQIFHNGIDIATDPKAEWVWQSGRGTYKVTGVRDGIKMTSIIDRTKSIIKTIFPVGRR